MRESVSRIEPRISRCSSKLRSRRYPTLACFGSVAGWIHEIPRGPSATEIDQASFVQRKQIGDEVKPIARLDLMEITFIPGVEDIFAPKFKKGSGTIAQVLGKIALEQRHEGVRCFF